MLNVLECKNYAQRYSASERVMATLQEIGIYHHKKQLKEI